MKEIPLPQMLNEQVLLDLFQHCDVFQGLVRLAFKAPVLVDPGDRPAAYSTYKIAEARQATWLNELANLFLKAWTRGHTSWELTALGPDHYFIWDQTQRQWTYHNTKTYYLRRDMIALLRDLTFERTANVSRRELARRTWVDEMFKLRKDL